MVLWCCGRSVVQTWLNTVCAWPSWRRITPPSPPRCSPPPRNIKKVVDRRARRHSSAPSSRCLPLHGVPTPTAVGNPPSESTPRTAQSLPVAATLAAAGPAAAVPPSSPAATRRAPAAVATHTPTSSRRTRSGRPPPRVDQPQVCERPVDGRRRGERPPAAPTMARHSTGRAANAGASRTAVRVGVILAGRASAQTRARSRAAAVARRAAAVRGRGGRGEGAPARRAGAPSRCPPCRGHHRSASAEGRRK